ncbi:MAG: TIGR02302 family protein [Pseudomonadota bacterium]
MATTRETDRRTTAAASQTDEPPFRPDRQTRARLTASRRAMVAERLVVALWPALAIGSALLGLTFFGLFAAVPADWHGVSVAVAGLLVLAALARGALLFRLPSPAEVRARLDESDMAGARPLATLADRQAAGREATFARALWLEHQRRAERAAEGLRARRADLRVSHRDIWGLRLFGPVLLGAGLLAAGGEWQARLTSLIKPTVPPAAEVAQFERIPLAEAWAVPPAYTGMGTVYLDREASAFTLPTGSAVTIRITDLDTEAVIDAPGVESTDGVRALGAGLHELTGTLRGNGSITVTGDGEVLAAWTISVIPDAPPTISFDGDPSGTFAGATEIPFRAADDYGVALAWAEILPPGGLAEAGSLVTEPLSITLPLPISGDPRQVSDAALEDVSEHPLAGGEVQMTLYAEDGAGQRGETETRTVMLPGRSFRHPLARALVEQRRSLALDFATAPRVLDVVQAVSRRPEEIFEEKHGAYLAVRSAVRRLATGITDDRVDEVAAEVTEFLWQAALELDGGDLNSALDRLRAAQEALEDALENGTEEDIRRAMEELRAAMDQYLQEFARQMMEQMQDGDQQATDPNGQQLSQQDLNEMLNEMQRRAESGLRDEARDMLNQLSQMLENLQMGRSQQGQQGSPGQQAMQQLQELIQRQRELSDRTFGEARRNQREGQQQGQQGQGQFGQGQSPGQQPGQQGQQPGQGQGQNQGQGDGGQFGQNGQPGGLSGEQQALRDMLNDLLGQLPGGIDQALRDALNGAEGAMGEARRDLDRGAPGDAVNDQLDALDRLNEGANALAQQLEQQGQGQQSAEGDGRGRGEGRDQRGADPFDRPAGRFGSVDGRDTGVPDRALMDRARELLDELRRRAGEATRPEYELDYFDRLIERY